MKMNITIDFMAWFFEYDTFYMIHTLEKHNYIEI